MPRQINLRIALAADAVASGGMGLLLALGAGLLSPWLGLSRPLLLGAGLALLPFAAFVAWTALRRPPPAGATRAILAINGAWIVASLVFVVMPPAPLTPLGVVFIMVQALAVLVLTLAQWVALRGDLHAGVESARRRSSWT